MALARQRTVTLEASVWVSALRVGEPSHALSARVIERLVEENVPLVEPVLFPVEVAAAVRRRTGDVGHAEWALRQVISLETLSLVSITEAVASEAARLAAHIGLRGADACNVAVARIEQSTLITLDEELARRASVVIDVVTPSTWLSRAPA